MLHLLHFWCSTLHSAQHYLYNSCKGRCTRYMWSNCISVIFYENRKCCLHIFPKQHFINELIFDIMNIQDNQSLEFEWIPILARIRFVNDWRFFMAYNNSLKSFQDWLNSVQHCQENFKRYWPKNRGKHMKYWKSALIKSLKLPNFFFNVRLSV